MITGIRIMMSWLWAAVYPTLIQMFTASGRIVWEAATVAVAEAEKMFQGQGMGALKFEYVLKEVGNEIAVQGVKMGNALIETIIQLAVIKLKEEVK
jgi:hypothetical protein